MTQGLILTGKMNSEGFAWQTKVSHSVLHPGVFTFKSLTDFLNDFKCPLGLYQRDLFVLKTVVKRGVPIAAVIGGGYSRDIDKLALRHSIVHRAATQVNETQQIEDLFVQFYVQKQLV